MCVSLAESSSESDVNCYCYISSLKARFRLVGECSLFQYLAIHFTRYSLIITHFQPSQHSNTQRWQDIAEKVDQGGICAFSVNSHNSKPGAKKGFWYFVALRLVTMVNVPVTATDSYQKYSLCKPQTHKRCARRLPLTLRRTSHYMHFNYLYCSVCFSVASLANLSVSCRGLASERARPPPRQKFWGGGGQFWAKFFSRAFGARRAALTFFGVVFSVFEAMWTL